MGEKKLKLLIVDDDEEILALLSATLNKTFSVTVALNGADAMEKLDAEKFDLISLDLHLPWKSGEDKSTENGLNIARNVKSSQSLCRTKIIVVTGYDSPSVINPLKKLGVEGILSKPYNPAELLDKIYEVLG